ncbi:hypothetical protein AD930_12860 [Acetobacter malorum]|nr:hypothetical protein AD930_12860 [Acetobacter malorum]
MWLVSRSHASTKIMPGEAHIEMAFAKLKALLRAKTARTVTALWDAAGSVLDAFSPDECTNFFIAAEYEPE